MRITLLPKGRTCQGTRQPRPDPPSTLPPCLPDGGVAKSKEATSFEVASFDLALVRRVLSLPGASGDEPAGNITARIKLVETSWICRRKSAI